MRLIVEEVLSIVETNSNQVQCGEPSNLRRVCLFIRFVIIDRYLACISQLIFLFEEKDRLLSFRFIYNCDPSNTKDIQGFLVNNYDIILTTLSSSGLSAFDSDYVNRKYLLNHLSYHS